MYIWIKNKLTDKNSTYSLQFDKFRIASLKNCEHDCKFFWKKKWLQIKGLINHGYVAYLKKVITFKQVSRCCLFFSGITLFWLPLVENSVDAIQIGRCQLHWKIGQCFQFSLYQEAIIDALFSRKDPSHKTSFHLLLMGFLCETTSQQPCSVLWVHSWMQGDSGK